MSQISARRRSSKTRYAPVKPSAPSLKTVNATRAKNAFGEIMKSVRKSELVFIERHGKAEAVVINVKDYHVLVRQARTPDEAQLESLREEFDALYAAMQSQKSRRAVDRLLSASAKDLNRTAAEHVRKRA